MINCEELKKRTERALLMARESKSNRIKLMFANNTLTITANSEKGNINDEIEIQLVGKDLEIAFNAIYIQDVMRVLDDECVYLNMNSRYALRNSFRSRAKHSITDSSVRLFTGA